MFDADAVRYLDARTANLTREMQEGFKRRYHVGYAAAMDIPSGTGRQSAAIAELNRWLTRQTERAAGVWIPLGATDSDIRDLADAKATEFFQLAAVAHDVTSLRAIMTGRCKRLGIAPPAETVGDLPAIRRMTAAAWWRRKIRRTQGALIEEIAIALGYVHRRRQCYCSDETVKRRRAQVRRNAMTLEAIELENQFGYAATVAELAARSISNPRIKRAELMTRMSGFESWARGVGQAAMFITLTCPSRFHAVLENGRPNPKHNGSTPRDGQTHLVESWAKCRSALHRRKVRPYGFRIAEPHHDGTPHWHLLLFVAPDQTKTLREMVLRYFLEQHDADETGARDNRVKFVAIDYERGTAAGYIAKYVSKAIDGEHIDGDDYGNSGKTTAERVTAWASAHGIRQFQQIGGAPVTTWRELRRLEASEDHPAVIAAARSAADAGNWERYIEVQGGPTVARRDLAVTLARTDEGERLDPDTGETEPAMNQYGEPAAPAIFGVCAADCGKVVMSRRFRWVTRNRTCGTPSGEEATRHRSAPWRAQRDSSKAQGRAARTRVNNCTQGLATAAPPALPTHVDRGDAASRTTEDGPTNTTPPHHPHQNTTPEAPARRRGFDD